MSVAVMPRVGATLRWLLVVGLINSPPSSVLSAAESRHANTLTGQRSSACGPSVVGMSAVGCRSLSCR